MKTLLELKPALDIYYDSEEAVQEGVFDDLLETLHENDPATLIPVIRQSFPLIEGSGIELIYEAIAQEPDAWLNFILEEHHRVFAEAQHHPTPHQVTVCLMCFSICDDEQFMQIGRKVVPVLETYLDVPNIKAQEAAIDLLCDWIDEDSAPSHRGAIAHIQQKLSSETWTVRRRAYQMLKPIQALPLGYSLPFMDRIRLWLGW